MRGSLTLLFLVLAAGCAGRRTGADLRSQLHTITHIDFEGNGAFSDRKLRTLMSIKQPGLTHPFRRSLYVRDLLLKDLAIVRDFYHDQGYQQFAILDVREDFNEAKRTVRLHVALSEGAITRVHALGWSGLTVFSEKEAGQIVKLHPGGPYSPFVSRADVERLAHAYVDKGYFFVAVRKVEEVTPEGANVTFVVEEGQPARLRVVETTGNVRTKRRYIERELELERGEVVTGKQLREGQRRLTKLGLFSLVRPRTVLVDSAQSIVDVVVDVRERKQGWYGLGFGFTSDERVRVTGEWGHRNVLGTTRRANVTGSIGWDVDSLFTRGADKDNSERIGRVTWVEPWVFGARVEGSFGVFHELDRKPRAFEYETNGLRAAFKREVSEFTDLFLTLENEWVQSNDTTLVSPDYVRQNLGVGGERDVRDDLLDPRQGSLERGNLQYSRLEHDYTYVKSLGSISHVGSRQDRTFAFRLEAGYIHSFVTSRVPGAEVDRLSKIPYQDRFFVGGATTLRGYRREEVGPLGTDGLTRGGTLLALVNAEYRFPIVWRFYGGVFLDAGNIWADPNELKLSRIVGSLGRSFSPLDVRYAMGAGLRVRTPVGPLRLDYGRKIGSGAESKYERPWEIHVSLGHAF